MSHILHAQHLVANYFEFHPETNQVSLATITEIKKKIEGHFKKLGIFVYVDYTKDSLINMLNNNEDLFARDKDEKYIILKDRQKLKEEIFFYFNPKIDTAIKVQYLDLMKTLCKKMEKKPPRDTGWL